MTTPSSISWMEEAAIHRLFGDGKTVPIRASQCQLKAINKRSQQFWRRNNQSARIRMSIPIVLKDALANFDQEMAIKPINLVSSFESHLSRSYGSSEELYRTRLQWKADPHFSQVVSSKGGSAKKADTLNKLIMRVVAKKPAIRQRELLCKLKALEGRGVIVKVDLDSGGVHFMDDLGQEHYVAKVKDRLSRIKCKIDSR